MAPFATDMSDAENAAAPPTVQEALPRLVSDTDDTPLSSPIPVSGSSRQYSMGTTIIGNNSSGEEEENPCKNNPFLATTLPTHYVSLMTRVNRS